MQGETKMFGMFENVFNSFLMDEHLKEREERVRKVGVYYVSELGGECLRQLFFRYTVNKPLDLFTLGVFKIGTVIHDLAESVFKEKFGLDGFKIECEV